MRNHRSPFVATEAQHYFPIRLNFAPCACCLHTPGFSGESLLNGYIRIACTCNQCRWQTIADSRFVYPDADAATTTGWCCWMLLLPHHRQAYFPENSIYISHRTTVPCTRCAGADVEHEFSILPRRTPLARSAHNMFCELAYIIFLSFDARTLHTRLGCSRSSSIHTRSMHRRFYCAYNSIDNL